MTLAALGHLLPSSLRPASPSALDDSSTSLRPRKQSTLVSVTNQCRSQMASSCELFGMLTALAAGGNSIDDDLTPSEDEDDSTQVHRTPALQDLPPSATSGIHEPRSEQEQKEQLERWVDDTLSKTNEQRDTLSSSFAGGC